MASLDGDTLGLALLDQIAFKLGCAGVGTQHETAERGVQINGLFQGSQFDPEVSEHQVVVEQLPGRSG